MQVGVGLAAYGFYYPRVAVTEAADANAGDEVEVSLALSIIQIHTFGAFYFERQGESAGLRHMSQEQLT
jgi:hypothetical protein